MRGDVMAVVCRWRRANASNQAESRSRHRAESPSIGPVPSAARGPSQPSRSASGRAGGCAMPSGLPGSNCHGWHRYIACRIWGL